MSKKQEEIIPIFENRQEECDFWKKKYYDKMKEMEELEESFNDFQLSSKDLEGEMEKELELKDKKIEELTSTNRRLKIDHDDSSEKTRKNTEYSSKMISTLQEDLASSQTLGKDLQQQKQKLEQENDTLETKERQLTASVQDLTKKLQEIMEENVVLQTEIEEYKMGSQETIQRMKDEIRDMKLELALVDRSKPTNGSTQGLNSRLDRLVDQISQQNSDAGSNVHSVPNGERSMANGSSKNMESLGSLDLVDDMLMLVKDMEQKLMRSKHSIDRSTPAENENGEETY